MGGQGSIVAEMKDYYGILGVPFDAGPNEIREAYRRLAFEWHPDRNFHRHEEAHARFLDLGEAYSVLRESRQRMEYDLARPAAERPQPPPPFSSSSETPEPDPTFGWEDIAAQARKAAAAESAESHGADHRAAEHEKRTSSANAARSMREHRLRVRKLARELASADRRGRMMDLALGAATLCALVVALLTSAFRMIGLNVPEFRPNLWLVAISWMTELVLLAWLFSLRERRVEQYEPYAEEVLARTGHGWSGPERADTATV